MDRLDAMSTLLAAIDGGSLSAASRKLGMPLATVSRKVSELEAYLGTRIVQRTSRRLILTDAGRSYVTASKRILEDVAEAERAAAGEYISPRGDLIITAPIVFGRLHVLPVVAEFLKNYPEINIRLALADRPFNLHEEDVDLAVRIGDMPDSSLIATRVGAIHRVICGSRTYFEKNGMPKRPQDLVKHECITFIRLTLAQEWNFTVDGKTVTIPIRSRLTVNTAEAAIDAAIASVGITNLLEYQIAKPLQSGKLLRILRKYETPAWPVSLVYGSRERLPIKLRAFLDFATPRLKARLAAI